MKNRTHPSRLVSKVFLFAAALAASAVPAFAELIVTPFGVWDTDATEVKVSYNVKTENGVETRTKSVSSRDVADKDKVGRLVKKLSAEKFIISPTDAESFTEKITVFQYRRAESKETAAQARVRRYNMAKAQIQAETRKFYKSRIPKAVAPMGQFINEAGGSMTLTDKNKKVIGTLIISYAVDSVPLPTTVADRDEYFPNSKIPLLSEAEFIAVTAIPDGWRIAKPKGIKHGVGGSSYQLPSGNYVVVKREGKLFRCFAYATRTVITFSYEKLKK